MFRIVQDGTTLLQLKLPICSAFTYKPYRLAHAGYVWIYKFLFDYLIQRLVLS